VTPPGRPGRTSAVLFGAAVAFVAGEGLVEAIRPALLLDPDPAWLPERFILWIALLSATASCGGLAGGLFLLWSRSRLARAGPGPLPLSRVSIVVITLAALGVGLLLRGAWIDRLPIPFLHDEVNLIGPVRQLSGTWKDFSNSIRPIPYGVPDPHEMIGMLYLRLFKVSLSVFGTTVLGVRFLSLVGGSLSLVTATLLGRSLLPRGGGALAALVLAGLRWHILLSLSGWHSILVAPLADVAALLLVRSHRTGRAACAAGAGLVIGVGPHFYLAAWIPAAALLAFSVWPRASTENREATARRVLAFAAGFVVAVAPLFLFREGREFPYFERTARHSVFREVGYASSLMPVFAAAADALPAPWFVPDPEASHDLPARSRLGWIIGVPVGLALMRSLLFPRELLSSLLLLQAAAAFAAAVAGGQAGHPNGFRFGYLSTWTAVAASAGVLQLVQFAPGRWRRAAAAVMIGLVCVSGLRGASDALLVWPHHRATFDAFHGEDTLLGRAAGRWESYGRVQVASGLGRSALTIDTVRRYQLDFERPKGARVRLRSEGDSATNAGRSFRIVAPGVRAARGERVVEHVRDDWGRDWAVVLGRLAGEL
jgi:hypothetical protein